MPRVERSITIAAPPSVVWRFFSDEQGLRQWLSADIEIDLQVGGHYRLLGADQATSITGTVLELVPEGRLVLSWFEEGGDWNFPARLVIALAACEKGTEVSLSHDGFAGIGKETWADTLKAYELGADRHHVLHQLAIVVTQSLG